MSLLTGPEIERQVRLGNIVITPFDKARLNPNSYNVRLSDKLLVYKMTAPMYIHGGYCGYSGYGLDMKEEPLTQEITIPSDGYWLLPGCLYLGATIEHTETRGFVPNIDGRSSVGRLGLFVHITAGRGDTQFKGTFTIELVAVHPIKVYAGVEIAQLSYTTVSGQEQPYVGKYNGQTGPKASGLWRDFLKKP